jgi:hypothetical protein
MFEMKHPPNPLRLALPIRQAQDDNRTRGNAKLKPFWISNLLAKQILKLTEYYCGEIPPLTSGG